MVVLLYINYFDLNFLIFIEARIAEFFFWVFCINLWEIFFAAFFYAFFSYTFFFEACIALARAVFFQAFMPLLMLFFITTTAFVHSILLFTSFFWLQFHFLHLDLFRQVILLSVARIASLLDYII